MQLIVEGTIGETLLFRGSIIRLFVSRELVWTLELSISGMNPKW